MEILRYILHKSIKIVSWAVMRRWIGGQFCRGVLKMAEDCSILCSEHNLRRRTTVKYLRYLSIVCAVICLFTCGCRQMSSGEEAVSTVSPEELTEIAEEGKTFPVECQFCDHIYEFTPQDILDILKKV